MTMKGHEVYKKLLEQYAEAYRAWTDTGEITTEIPSIKPRVSRR